ncbi:hypothetical protein PENPOL_c049G01591 [Penicillium polonicum]|uniref:Uncharacterized protein n=1 Tax=Penicillium polonicum TaxID=60169 RepID=A0A1V6N5H8_PENPO|nr:hypothetical protein PENPOL_c049G01591 [Penicillium polonicum]
MGEKQRIG